MVSFLEVLDRMETGKYSLEQDFDIKLFWPKVNRLIKEYDIKRDPNVFVPDDDSLADDVFEAGFRLALECGIFCTNTSRIIKFDEADLKEALLLVPEKISLGVGKDAIEVKARKPEDTTLPTVQAGPTGSPVTEGELFVKIHQSYCQEPIIKMLNAGYPTTILGRNVKPGSPLEVYGGILELMWLREAMRRAGRPGMPTNAGAGIAGASFPIAFHEELGLRKSDIPVVAMLSEMKTDYERMRKPVTILQRKGYPMALVDPIIGGYSGGPDGTAVTGVAELISSAIIYQAKAFLFGPAHAILGGISTYPENIWVRTIVGQAVSRNSHMIIFSGCRAASGPCTNMIFKEMTANFVAAAASGYNFNGTAPCGGVRLDHMSGLEGRFLGEVAHASTGMKRSDANDLVKTLYSKYKDRLRNPPLGKAFQECYDASTVRPKREYLELYLKNKKEIADLGLRFKF